MFISAVWRGSPLTTVGSLRPGACMAREVDQSVLADLNLVAALQEDVVDAVSIDVCAVETPDIDHGVALGATSELRVPARDRDVVEEDLALRMPAGRDHFGV